MTEAVVESVESESAEPAYPVIAPAPAEAAITSTAELRELLGTPMERAINKERVRLQPMASAHQSARACGSAESTTTWQLNAMIRRYRLAADQRLPATSS